MFTSKTTVITGKISDKLSKSVDKLMNKGSEMLDAGMDVMHDAFKELETSENVKVTATIRVRLTSAQIDQLKMGAVLSFQADGTMIRLEPDK